MTDEVRSLSPVPFRDSRLEELHAGLHDVIRLMELEHHLLRGRLDTLKADSEGAQLLEGIIVLGGVLNRKLTHLLGLCRDVGGL
ncbi:MULTISPECIES: hypothetical protein [Acetobacteraceae]|uniref:Uncharacterized protein n=2 Tax=Acetobacter TaxID=434 RepID=A0A177G725_9PROT|nr:MULTISPECIES: hypothetical protein [Acetobacteraceae]KXV50553.1 hypothetical protein AD944_04675 [Acetobacter tropicalis]MDN7351683.1 hypothetical protein [Acetobacter senegalensis]OAG75601.1 hypothetical protein Amal_03215 [Acetobacter malorum]GAL98851.1 conserved hypothetical protein [Acetobacter tropicalis]GBR69445.1 hypothetical protein AA0312_1395 [Acetobacter tropicalis NRIC 0312]